MTCIEGWTSCNGFFLLILSMLAIAFNLTPLIADYVEDQRLLYSPISCYEWWLPGMVGGGLLVLPGVAMSLAARRKGSCNSRCGMLTSAVLSLLVILGAAYCTIISLFAIDRGPLICDTGTHDVNNCDYTLGNFSSFENIRFDLSWFQNTTCLETNNPDDLSNGIMRERLLDLEIDENTQKIIHIVVFVALAIIGLLEALVGIFQIVAGVFGFICGTSKRRDDDDDD
ncbi:transmembrane 4 L6 family member 20 [Pelobates fuscus]|uniref:transmembrane 4 L6 family member 20 n=1 Tax=Pelobates fuscus TaxID=191477 RepID=UPI002FE4E87D